MPLQKNRISSSEELEDQRSETHVKHPKRQLRQIADSIERFGFTNPILVDWPAP